LNSSRQPLEGYEHEGRHGLMAGWDDAHFHHISLHRGVSNRQYYSAHFLIFKAIQLRENVQVLQDVVER
jgi:hypothetical protein